MKNKYDIKELSLMSGYTTRSLRMFIKDNILQGVQENGKWYFTKEQLDVFFTHPYIRQGLEVKHSNIWKDYMKEKTTEKACLVVDASYTEEEITEIIDYVNQHFSKGFELSFHKENDSISRLILSSSIEDIASVMSYVTRKKS